MKLWRPRPVLYTYPGTVSRGDPTCKVMEEGRPLDSPHLLFCVFYIFIMNTTALTDLFLFSLSMQLTQDLREPKGRKGGQDTDQNALPKEAERTLGAPNLGWDRHSERPGDAWPTGPTDQIGRRSHNTRSGAKDQPLPSRDQVR